MFDYLIITHLPSFYKVNLYNGLIESGLKIKVLFIGISSSDREKDFTKNRNEMKFDYSYLSLGNFDRCNSVSATAIKIIIRLFKELKKSRYQLLIVSGWDLIPFWLTVFIISSKEINCLSLENTIYDSRHIGVGGLIKKTFLKRIKYVFPSGELHVQLLKSLNYTGDYFITKGVGLINKLNKRTIARKDNSFKVKFLFVGRLIQEKNLLFMCTVFNELITEDRLPITLTIIGRGIVSNDLSKFINDQIVLIDYIPNNKLDNYYLNNDIFILPSISEPWGLVIEEALYYKLPVLISNRCGARELIEEGKSGYWFDPFDENDLKKKIRLILSKNTLLEMKEYVSEIDLNKNDACQVMAYHKPFSL